MSYVPERLRAIQEEFDDISASFDERRIRLWCAAKARAYNRIHGRGGVTSVYKATGVSRPRIYVGLKEITSDEKLDKDRIRRKGGGRKKVVEKQPTLLSDLEGLVEPLSRGAPESPLRWTCKSTYKLRDELIAQGYKISQPKVGEVLSGLGYSLQSNRKTKEGGNHPDRNAQFEYILNALEFLKIPTIERYSAPLRSPLQTKWFVVRHETQWSAVERLSA